MRVLKWDVPVDDSEHLIGWGQVVHVQCQFTASEVQVWTLEVDGREPTRIARVYGTGHEVPAHLEWIGSTVPNPALVWHCFAEPDR